MSPLTTHLVAAHPSALSAATTHAFLSQAGRGTLPSSPLCRWLVQDKYYQFAYVNFMGRLISKLDLTSYAFPKGGDKDGNLHWKTLQTLLGAMNAIKAEIDFYNETVRKYGLDLQEEGPNEVTSEYVKLFEESSREGRPLVEGLTVLWATEFCYLQAWKFAKEQSEEAGADSLAEIKEGKGAIGALHREFIPNWTSDGFREAVEGLASVTDAWAAEVEKGSEASCEALWERTLDLEARFWPDV